MSSQQQVMVAHDAVDALVVDAHSPVAVTAPIDHRPRSPITVGRQWRDLGLDLGDQRGVSARLAVTASIGPFCTTSCPYLQVGARYTQDFTHRSSSVVPGQQG